MTLQEQLDKIMMDIIEMAWTDSEHDRGLFAGIILALNTKLGMEAYKMINGGDELN